MGRKSGLPAPTPCSIAKEHGCEWLFFLDYDVILAPNTLKQLEYRTKTHPGFDVYAGVYCIKERPAQPLIYKGWGDGFFLDWTIGDVLTEGIVASGLGCASCGSQHSTNWRTRRRNLGSRRTLTTRTATR